MANANASTVCSSLFQAEPSSLSFFIFSRVSVLIHLSSRGASKTFYIDAPTFVVLSKRFFACHRS